MSQTIFFDASYVVVSWDSEVECVIIDWRPEAKDEKFKQGLEKALELLVEKKAGRWLGDTRKLTPFGNELQKWLTEDWNPRAKKAGLAYAALVIPESALSRLALNAYREGVVGEEGWEINYFANPEEGKAWLKSRPA